MAQHQQLIEASICRFCGSDYVDGFDDHGTGWWCECDAFNYFNPFDDDRKFTLVLESKSNIDSARQHVNVRLNKRLSPLRFPGGKSKITDYLFNKLNLTKSRKLVSPFSGGASVELALLHGKVIDELVLNDYDYGIYALFESIKTDPTELIRRIQSLVPSHDDYYKAQVIVKSGYVGCDLIEAAWNMLLNNRLAYSGIYYANPLGGKGGDQTKLLSRWNPSDLIKRITTIHEMGDKITVLNMDACDLIAEEYWSSSDNSILIDPPYFRNGKYMYRCFYKEEDHIKLNVLLEGLYTGFPGADILLCYDDEEFIERLYWFPQVEKISRTFSA